MPWLLSIDTGGTFTDCLAVDPSGDERRVKVLSTGTLRATVNFSRDKSISIAETWEAPQDFAVGATVRKLATGEAVGVVRRHDRNTADTTLELESRFPIRLTPGDAVEVDFHEEAPLLAARLATRTPRGQPLPAIDMRLATTRGTNALLTRSIAPVAFFVTRGFADLLLIGDQQRPDIFALDITRPAPFYAHAIEVAESLAADGSVLVPLDESALRAQARFLASQGITTAAIALKHAWRNPGHEQRAAAILAEAGFTHVSISSSLAPSIGLVDRARTAAINAALAPIIDAYLGGVGAGLGPGSRLRVMTSAGGLVSAAAFNPKDSLLSGPAGGVVGAAAAASRSGFARVITFDMGGTSTDAARFEGRHSLVFEHSVNGARILAPAVNVESVAAGGGSVCWHDGQSLRVGPQSAGAKPGPACYGAGGPLTVTDCNLLLGRLDPSRFEIPLNPAAAQVRADELIATLPDSSDQSLQAILESFLAIADEHMAHAIRTVSTRRGEDPETHTLVAFGGAGGQHACAVAELLGMSTVLIPADVGLLSAFGLSRASIERVESAVVLRPLAQCADLAQLLLALERRAVAQLTPEVAAGAPPVSIRRLADVRLRGQDSAIQLELGAEAGITDLSASFARSYLSLYGYAPPPTRELELVSVRVVASAPPTPQAPVPSAAVHYTAEPDRTARVCVEGRWADLPIFDREGLEPGASIAGPALITEQFGTTFVRPAWAATIDPARAIVLHIVPGATAAGAAGGSPASASSSSSSSYSSQATAWHHSQARGVSPGSAPPDRLEPRRAGANPNASNSSPSLAPIELLTGRLYALATDMGETLRRTALSTNVKERLDYSCAILDATGELLVNAPHLPVHLGALGPCVRKVMETMPLVPGDVVVTNHPAFGGSHLPDVTVITPVYVGTERIGFTASRAHHAEIGGTRPGSMPPAAKSLAEEGVVIPPTYLARAGVADMDTLRRILLEAPHPTRNVDENLADLSAQVAANHVGAAELASIAHRLGLAAFREQCDAIKSRAHAKVSGALARLGAGIFRAVEKLDDGSPIAVEITIRNDATSSWSATFDFTGSAPVHPGNFNAPPWIARSAVIYVLRLLIDENLPLNEGLLKAIALNIPPGMLNPPFEADATRCPPVAAGNVETSQRIVDTLLKALGVAACSQGTMNNVIFGNSRFGYYETVCGGAGATPHAPGASAVHTHMTNTRITDPEVLELRYPVRLHRFAIRKGSGGEGAHPGGDGAIREYEFLEPVSLSLITQHRTEAPFGINGGGTGAQGKQELVRADGTREPVAGVASLELSPGDRLILETPGGGGCGS